MSKRGGHHHHVCFHFHFLNNITNWIKARRSSPPRMYSLSLSKQYHQLPSKRGGHHHKECIHFHFLNNITNWIRANLFSLPSCTQTSEESHITESIASTDTVKVLFVPSIIISYIIKIINISAMINTMTSVLRFLKRLRRVSLLMLRPLDVLLASFTGNADKTFFFGSKVKKGKKFNDIEGGLLEG